MIKTKRSQALLDRKNNMKKSLEYRRFHLDETVIAGSVHFQYIIAS